MKSLRELADIVMLCIEDNDLKGIVRIQYQEKNAFFPERFSCYYSGIVNHPIFYTRGYYFMAQGVRLDYTSDNNDDEILIVLEKILGEIKQLRK